MASILWYAMSKCYVKDEQGKYKLVEKKETQQQQQTTLEVETETEQPLTLEERIARLEDIILALDLKK